MYFKGPHVERLFGMIVSVKNMDRDRLPFSVDSAFDQSSFQDAAAGETVRLEIKKDDQSGVHRPRFYQKKEHGATKKGSCKER